MAVKNARRYALLQSYVELSRDEMGLAGFWRAKQEERTGAALPVTFPFMSRLTAARYTTEEDLDGADADELQANAGLSRREAQAVLTAAAAL